MGKNNLRPAIKLGPGYFIKEQMEYRNWTQEDLADVMGITIKHLNKILTYKQTITLEIAKLLSEIFNTSPQYWLNLDYNYRLWLDSDKSTKQIETEYRTKIYERFPVTEMIKKGWLPKFKSFDELKTGIANFVGKSKIDFGQWDKLTAPLLARKSESYNQYNASYAYSWYIQALSISKEFSVGKFNKERLADVFNRINQFTIKSNGINLFLNELNQSGIIFFVLPHLQKTYLDGASFFSDENPVIVFTARYKRIDNFWFTVAHEIAHILEHMTSEDNLFLDNFSENDKTELEQEANSLAAQKLKHKEILDYLSDHLNYLTKAKVMECSEMLEVHPAIVVGKLAHDNVVSYSNQKLFNDNVLDLIDKKFLKLN